MKKKWTSDIAFICESDNSVFDSYSKSSCVLDIAAYQRAYSKRIYERNFCAILKAQPELLCSPFPIDCIKFGLEKGSVM